MDEEVSLPRQMTEAELERAAIRACREWDMDPDRTSSVATEPTVAAIKTCEDGLID